MPDWTSILTWMATYWLHSTLLLGGTWLWLRWRCPASHALRESAWKLAALGAFLTASLQLGLGIESPLNAAFRTAFSKPRDTQYANSVIHETEAPRTASQLNSNRQRLTEGSPKESFRKTDSSTLEQESRVHYVILDPESMELDTAFVQTPVADDTQASNDMEQADALPSGLTLEQNAAGLQWSVSLGRILISVLMALGGAVIALSLFGMLKLMIQQAGFIKRIRTYQEVERGRGRLLLDRLLTQSQIARRVVLYLADNEMEPGAWGLFTWKIVLPPRAIEELSDEELRALLAHELAHLVRHDQVWIWIGHVLAIGFGWQPLNRLAFRQWRQNSEYLCDAWAVERSVTRLSLARCLTSVAEWRLSSVVPLAGVGGENRSSLSHRVERLLDDQPLHDPWLKPSRRQWLAAAVSFLAMAMVCCAPNAALRAAPEFPSVAPSDPETSASKQSLIQGELESSGAAENSLDQSQVERETDESQDSLMQQDLEAFEARLHKVTLPLNSIRHDQMTLVVLREVTTEMEDLVSELSQLETAISQSPRFTDSPVVQLQLKRFRVRLQSFIRIRQTLTQSL